MYLVTRECLPLMPDGSRIINLSSVLGRFGVPGYTAYCATKHGVIGFTRALALELAPRGITVNALVPGWVDTDMAVDGNEERRARDAERPSSSFAIRPLAPCPSGGSFSLRRSRASRGS